MSEARRTLRQLLLAALLERGVDPWQAVRRHHGQPVRVTRPLSRRECREFVGPYSGVRFMPSPVARRRA